MSNIESVLKESRVFPPSAAFVKQANISGKAAYEALPAGTYTWKIVRVAGAEEPVTLTVKW